MGNTILAHALFSCHQVDLDLDRFFSSTGDAHAIVDINSSELTALHLAEMPNPALTCVLEIVCTNWWEALRIKMSYSKWMQSTPGLENFSKFYSYHADSDSEQARLWQEFYQAVRDPAWPDCASPAEIAQLPVRIQQEINQLYTVPDLSAPVTTDRFVEWLCGTYHTNFSNLARHWSSVPVLELGQYLSGNHAALEHMCTDQLGWNWDADRSKKFFDQVLQVNQKYFAWLESIQTATDAVIAQQTVTESFDLWEQALILARACELTGTVPQSLNWDTNSCNTVENNVYLNKFKR